MYNLALSVSFNFRDFCRPVTITKIQPPKEHRKTNEKSRSCGKDFKHGISRSCSEETSSSLLVQTGSTICSLSAASRYSTDTVIAEDPMDTTVFNRYV